MMKKENRKRKNILIYIYSQKNKKEINNIERRYARITLAY
jgi:hypothetical protein